MNKNIYYYAKNMAFLIFCICLILLKNDKEVYGCVGADGVITTCIWATTYDENKHWEYCTLCGDTRNEVVHTMVDNWFTGEESCIHYNYSTRICECGYNYVYRKPHTEDTTWRTMKGRLVHANYCAVCETWLKEGFCEDEDGLLGCKNPGTCTKCNFVATKDNHYIDHDGKCKFCDEKFLSITTPIIVYSSDYSKATATFDMIPEKGKNIELTGAMSSYTWTKNYTEEIWSHTKNSDGSVSYKVEYVFNSGTQIKSEITICDIYETGAFLTNGVFSYISIEAFPNATFTIWQDHEESQITDIKQVDQKTSNDWATIKELTINGVDNLSAVVNVSIIDKLTGEVILCDAKAPVVNGKFTYVCTPPLEGPVEGRTYICRVVDETGNELNHEFVIYKTDSKAPRLASGTEYTQWSKTKVLNLELIDYGSGSVQTSVTDQNSYKNTKYIDGKYVTEHIFDQDNYGTTQYSMFMKDGLGNATKTSITVGKIDNTKPTITDVKSSLEGAEVAVTVTANDMNTKLRAEGSGVYRYAVTSAYAEPTDDKWQASNELRVNSVGTYYIWVKDLVGNIGDVRKLTITDGVVNTDKIIYDSAQEKEDIKGKDADTEELELYDDTPKTGDYREVKVYIAYMIISFIGMTMIMLGVFVRRYIMHR